MANNPLPLVTAIAILLGATLIGALILLPTRAVWRTPGVLSHQRKRIEHGSRPGDRLIDDVCALALGDWCLEWSHPSRRKRKLALPSGTAHLETYNKSCLWNNACNEVGVCDRMTGRCRCAAGWQGDACEERLDRPCSEISRPWGSFLADNTPFTFWTARARKNSVCAGECDTNYGACFCPQWTKYGRIKNADQRKDPVQHGRPMGLNCQPKTDEAGNDIGAGSFSYEALFGPDGWCEADQPAIRCSCAESGDGLDGELCEVPVEHFCTGQLNGKGKCRNGFFHCDDGWTGQDCSIDVSELSSEPRSSLKAKGAEGLQAHRDRPLIYVYDLPPIYNARMIEYKLQVSHCVHRLFDEKGRTEWVKGQYITETGLHELLLESSHRTLDPEEADFFYVPVYASCYMMPVYGYADMPYFHTMPLGGHRVVGATNMLIEAHHFIRTQHPYWDRNGGRDHILLNAHDEGSCWIPDVFRPAIILSHWGYFGPRRRFSTYEGDKFDHEERDPIYHPESHLANLGDHLCFDREKDIVLPLMAAFGVKFPSSPWLNESKSDKYVALDEKRDILGLHVGRTLAWIPEFSNGTRQGLEQLVKKHKWWDKYRIFVGEGSELPEEIASSSYSELLSRSTYCFVLMGEGWTSRFEDAIAHMCVPVIVFHDTLMPFETHLDVSSFAIRVPISDMKRIPKILEEHLPRVKTYQKRIIQVHSRFEWRYERFKSSALQHPADKDRRPLDPSKPDAFDTLMAILHSKLPDGELDRK